MKFSAFVLDHRECLDRARLFGERGWLDAVYVQVEHWDHAGINRAAFPTYKTKLNPLGVKVGATLWGTEPATIPARLAAHREELRPDLWEFNFEKVPGDGQGMEGVDVQPIMVASRPEPVRVSYNDFAERSGYDFRHYSMRGADVRGQCYDVDGNMKNAPGPPSQMVASCFLPGPAIEGGGGPAWWYRVMADGRWWWMQLRADGSMRSPTGKIVWPDRDGGRFAASRAVRVSPGAAVCGKVYGYAPWHRIGWAAGVTRPVSPDELQAFARAAVHPITGAVCRDVDVFTLDNVTEDQARAIAEAA